MQVLVIILVPVKFLPAWTASVWDPLNDFHPPPELERMDLILKDKNSLWADDFLS